MDSPHIPPYTNGGAVNPEPHVFMETKSRKGSLRSSVESATFPHSPDPSVHCGRSGSQGGSGGGLAGLGVGVR